MYVRYVEASLKKDGQRKSALQSYEKTLTSQQRRMMRSCVMIATSNLWLKYSINEKYRVGETSFYWMRSPILYGLAFIDQLEFEEQAYKMALERSSGNAIGG